MKSMMLLLTVFFLTACTSLQAIEKSPAALQMQIKNQEILQVGSMVRVYTKSGLSHKFVITEITQSKIVGTEIIVPIKDISALEVKRTSKLKTGLLIGGVALLVYLNSVGNGIKNSGLFEGFDIL